MMIFIFKKKVIEGKYVYPKSISCKYDASKEIFAL